MDLSEELLRASPGEAVRRTALALVDEAVAACERWARPDAPPGDAPADSDEPRDDDALHDFRVALRRLRSHLRAWRDELRGDVRRKHRRALRAVQAATGGGRDAEVGLAWLAEQASSLEPRHAAGRAWMQDLLERRKERADADAREHASRDFLRVAAKLRPRLERLRVEVRLDDARPPPRHARVLAQRVREHHAELARALAEVTCAADRAEAHAARIRAKRLRYLAEPVAKALPAAGALVGDLKRLQDLLGALNDAHVLGAELDAAEARSDADAPPERARAGLLELALRSEELRASLFETLARDRLGERGRAALAELAEDLARALEAAARRGVEIERKFLLSGMPDLPAGAEELEIEQGWLPGRTLRERVRRTRRSGSRDGAVYHRALKLGRGVERVEIEEETTREVFEALWPLTEGVRIRKRRLRVADGGLVWEVDAFAGRELWLAEVELEDAEQAAPPPAWLAPFVVREVTGERAFTNLALAGG